MREVVVLGVGQSQFGKFPERTAQEMGVEAVNAAIKDAGISPKQIQTAHTARTIGPNTDSQFILKEFGISNIEMVNVNNACAGGATAIRGVWKDIANGLYDVGIAIGVEAITSSPVAGALLASSGDIEAELGLSMPALFACIARRQMEEFGATPEDFAQVSVKNHDHGLLNPMAQYQKKFTIEQVMESRMICDPITLFQCCPNTDGAAAVILCTEKFARQFTTTPIRIAGSALLSGDYSFRQTDLTFSPFGLQTANMAYEMAGVGPEDVNVVELHDAFAPEEIMRYEDLGLCKRGEAVKLLRSGDTALGGRVPVNPSGGLLSLGHPLSASGVRVVGDIARQLRGDAGKCQVPDAKVGVAHMLGGSVTGLEGGACGIHVLVR